MADALAWAGTFHGIGARLLREYAEQIGLDPAFTIHDREDFGRPDEPGPARARLLQDARAGFRPRAPASRIYSRAVNAETPLDDVLRTSFPWCADWSAELRELFAAYVEAKQQQNVLDYDDLLLYWAQTSATRRSPRTSARASTMCWSTSIRTPTGCRPRSCWR